MDSTGDYCTGACVAVRWLYISASDLPVIWVLLARGQSVNVTLRDRLWTCSVVSHPLTSQRSCGRWMEKFVGGHALPTEATAPHLKGALVPLWCMGLRCQAPLGQSPEQGDAPSGEGMSQLTLGQRFMSRYRFEWLRLTPHRQGVQDGFPSLVIKKGSMYFWLSEYQKETLCSKSHFFHCFSAQTSKTSAAGTHDEVIPDPYVTVNSLAAFPLRM